MLRFKQISIPANTVIDLLDVMDVPLGKYRIHFQASGTVEPLIVNDASATSGGFVLGLNAGGLNTAQFLDVGGDTVFLRAGSETAAVRVLLSSIPESFVGPISTTTTFDY